MTQEEINDLLERPQPTCASMLNVQMEAELSSALATADRAAARLEEAAARLEEAAALPAAWSAAKQLADVVRVLRKIEGGTQE